VALATAACSGSKAMTTSAVPTTTAAPPDTVPGAVGALQDAFVSLVTRLRPSVVEISTSEGLGSGVVHDGKGNIVTNAHVVGNATSFRVSLVDGRTLNGTLVNVRNRSSASAPFLPNRVR
jgi:putative serine protease PepD